MSRHINSQFSLLLKFLKVDANLMTGDAPSMTFKRRFSGTRVCQTNKKIKLDTNNSLHGRQWENVSKPTQGTHDWFKFSIASYNVLSQNLLEMNKHLYKNCNPTHASWNFRSSVIRDELAHHRPDILCLQEVHHTQFDRFFLPELQKLGYFGLYKKRTGEKEDGCATFFKQEKFKCVSSRAMEYKLEGVNILNRDNVGLILLLKPNVAKKIGKNGGGDAMTEEEKKLNDFRLCIANTHLLFNPKRGDVKLAQLMTLLAGVDEIAGGSNHSVVMCGDFNSLPLSGIYNFLLSGHLDLKDVNVKFFSGQIFPSDSLNPSTLGSSLSPNFLAEVESLTDQCQFVDVLRSRMLEADRNLSKKLPKDLSRKKNGKTGEKKKEDEDVSPFTRGSGLISHRLNLNSVYDHKNHRHDDRSKQVTTYLDKKCETVDYMFYSNANQKGVKVIPQSNGEAAHSNSPIDLHLLRRLKLFTESQIKSSYRCLPSGDLGSDHTILMSEFAVKL